MTKSTKPTVAVMIENQEHFQQLEKSPSYASYVLVRRVDNKSLMYIPLNWMHRPACAQKATPKMVLWCFYSACIGDAPWFKGNLTAVNVIQIFAGRKNDPNSDEERFKRSTCIQVSKDLDKKSMLVEAKLKQAIEMASLKSSQSRITALQHISNTLSTVFKPEIIQSQQSAIVDILKKALRHGNDEEQSLVAQIVPMLIVNLGDGEDMMKNITPLLRQILVNKAISFNVRSNCCSGLTLATFLIDSHTDDTMHLMQQLENMFSDGDDIAADEGVFLKTALTGWGLMLTRMPPVQLVKLFNKGAFDITINNLSHLLESEHLDIRVTAGEVFALFVETGRTYDKDFLADHYLPKLIDSCRALTVESNKYRAKRHLKTQRATFRDILRYLESNVAPDFVVQLPDDTLRLNTWLLYFKYTVICAAIGSGMKTHLAENNFLRGVLQLGDRVLVPSRFQKIDERWERRYDSKVAAKDRSKDQRSLPCK